MSMGENECACHKVGGPFVAEDPDCPIHQDGGYEDRIAALEAENERLRRAPVLDEGTVAVLRDLERDDAPVIHDMGEFGSVDLRDVAGKILLAIEGDSH